VFFWQPVVQRSFFYRVLQVGGLLVAVVLIFCAGAIYYVQKGCR